MTNRRGFLVAIGGAMACAAALDPDKLLWTPGRKHFSIPAPPKVYIRVSRHNGIERMEAVIDHELKPLPGISFSNVHSGRTFKEAIRKQGTWWSESRAADELESYLEEREGRLVGLDSFILGFKAWKHPILGLMAESA